MRDWTQRFLNNKKKSDTEVNWHVQPSNKFRENVLIPYLNLEHGGNSIILNKKSSLSW